MGYRFNQQASFHIFHHILTIWMWTQILTSIWRDAMIIVNLDDPNV
jgi:hypothetical protein